jgi:hypothetical protein
MGGAGIGAVARTFLMRALISASVPASPASAGASLPPRRRGSGTFGSAQSLPCTNWLPVETGPVERV